MRRTSKRNRNGKKKGFVIILVLIVFLLSSALLLYSRFWKETSAFISPLASSNQNAAKTLEKLLLDSEIEFSSVVLRNPSSYMVKLKEDGEAILSINKDLKNQIDSLQAVLKQLTIEGKRVVRIDFRFERPTIELRD
ncbi:MAG: hypothetical protein ACD_50C00275G0006 [uncultured bacterium]|nr:MAG: hypothetical protein ACD_50C00275G0006 [uncultured bacterium]OGH13832.1 MAG: hypothetical protein A2687_04700 [Candidatus Levybacteria bacterium RIFCSPHIGHO2_01_FULL_38_26]